MAELKLTIPEFNFYLAQGQDLTIPGTYVTDGLTTADGIRFFFQGITLEDVVNYRINAGFNLYLDNVQITPLKFTDGARLYKANGDGDCGGIK